MRALGVNEMLDVIQCGLKEIDGVRLRLTDTGLVWNSRRGGAAKVSGIWVCRSSQLSVGLSLSLPCPGTLK